MLYELKGRKDLTSMNVCWYHILPALNLHAEPRKIKNIIFSPWGREKIQNNMT